MNWHFWILGTALAFGLLGWVFALEGIRVNFGVFLFALLVSGIFSWVLAAGAALNLLEHYGGMKEK